MVQRRSSVGSRAVLRSAVVVWQCALALTNLCSPSCPWLCLGLRAGFVGVSGHGLLCLVGCLLSACCGACVPFLQALPAYGSVGVSDACVSYGSLAFHACTVVSASLHSCLSQQCMCFMGRANVRFMPCACCLFTQTCVPTGYLLTLVGKRPARQRICLVSMVGRGLGPRVIIGMAWSELTNTLVCMFGWFRPVALGGLIVTN
jgi:hypothetical protein